MSGAAILAPGVTAALHPVVVCLLLMLAARSAHGQQLSPVNPQFPEGDIGPSLVPSPSDTSPPVIAPTVCYWTVSSRGLPQQPIPCASHRLGYYETLADGTLRATTRETMVAQLTPGVPICIFIHGSFVDARTHRLESAHTFNWIRNSAPQLPAHILFYTWPSEARHNTLASANPVAVNERGRWAENNAFYLVDLISQLPHESPICLVGHSHGARTTAATLHLAAGGVIGGRSYPHDTGCNRRYRAVLAAGALDRNWLDPGQRYDFAVRRAEGILNLVNHTDAALHFYPMRKVFSRKAIAVTGLTRWDRIRLGPLGQKVIDYDVTRLIGLGHFWPNYYDEPSIGLAISPYVYFTDAQLNPTYHLASIP